MHILIKRIEMFVVFTYIRLSYILRYYYRYSYGKPVKGTLLLKSTPQTPMWRWKPNLPEIHYETEVGNFFHHYIISWNQSFCLYKISPQNETIFVKLYCSQKSNDYFHHKEIGEIQQTLISAKIIRKKLFQFVISTF